MNTLKSLQSKVMFVIRRANHGGFKQISPLLALSWINKIVPVGKVFTEKQACRAFYLLGKKGLIRKVRQGEICSLDAWEIV